MAQHSRVHTAAYGIGFWPLKKKPRLLVGITGAVMEVLTMEQNPKIKHSTPSGGSASPPLEAALSYLRRGWSVIPVNQNKCPLIPWQPFQLRRATEEEIRGWFEKYPKAGVGIVCGKTSGLVVLDIDPRNGGDTTLANWSERGLRLPEGPTAKTGSGGCHFYLRHPEGEVPTIAGLARGIDLKSEGSYVKAPPSPHPSGQTYAWYPGSSPDNVAPPQPPAWLLDLVKERHKSGDGDRRELGWVEALLAGVPKGQRDDAATRLAGHLIGKGLPASEVEAVLLAWNTRNRPPWGEDSSDKGTPEEWVKAKVASVVKLEAKKAGERKDGQRPAFEVPPPEPYPWHPWAALTNGNLPPMPWIVEGVLPEAQTLGIGGMAAYGKSWLLLTMAAAIASGRPWLEHFPTRPGPVLYLDEESSEYELRRRLHRLTEGLGLDPKALGVNFVLSSGLRLSDLGGLARLEATIKEIHPLVIMVDTLIRILGYDENDATRVAAAFRSVSELKNRHNVAFVFADHHRKPTGYDPGPEFWLRGSTDKANYLDSILTIRRSRSGQLQVMHTKARFGRAVPTFGFAIEDRGEGTVLTHQVVAEEEEKALRIDEAKAVIMGLFTSAETKVTRQAILQALEGEVGETWADETLLDLVRGGQLGKGRKGRERTYHLRPPAPAEGEA